MAALQAAQYFIRYYGKLTFRFASPASCVASGHWPVLVARCVGFHTNQWQPQRQKHRSLWMSVSTVQRSNHVYLRRGPCCSCSPQSTDGASCRCLSLTPDASVLGALSVPGLNSAGFGVATLYMYIATVQKLQWCGQSRLTKEDPASVQCA